MAFYAEDLVPSHLITVHVCRLCTDGRVQDVPDLDEFFAEEAHVRTGKIYYRNSTFRVYYHQRPPLQGLHSRFGSGTAVIFQLDNTGKISLPEVDDDVFHGVISM